MERKSRYFIKLTLFIERIRKITTIYNFLAFSAILSGAAYATYEACCYHDTYAEYGNIIFAVVLSIPIA